MKNTFARRSSRQRTKHIGGWLLLISLCVITFIAVPVLLKVEHEPPAPIQVTLEAPVAEAAPEPAPIPLRFHEGVIRSGDTISSLLDSYCTSREIYELGKICKPVFPITRINTGRPYKITTSEEQLVSFEYEINGDEKLIINKGDSAFTAELQPIIYDVKTEVLHGVILSSLFEAIDDIGESPSLAVQLADIFAWDIDFVREIRKNDTFTVMTEKRFRNGEFAGYGRILAAEFVNQGTPHRGYLFSPENGRSDYFDDNGRSLRKAFLKAPLKFSRISSGFSMRRLHPVKKVYRPHPAIDYAAPKGTPVRAIGDGTVFYRGYDKAAGNMIKIRHGSVYQTYYLHMSKFARSVKKGSRVLQGQVIGYVGSTGYSTGPHLDFRMKKNGSYVNPRRVVTPSAKSVPKDEMIAFNIERKQYASSLARASAQYALSQRLPGGGY